mgnify:CR=1 FL=1
MTNGISSKSLNYVLAPFTKDGMYKIGSNLYYMRSKTPLSEVDEAILSCFYFGRALGFVNQGLMVLDSLRKSVDKSAKISVSSRVVKINMTYNRGALYLAIEHVYNQLKVLHHEIWHYFQVDPNSEHQLILTKVDDNNVADIKERFDRYHSLRSLNYDCYILREQVKNTKHLVISDKLVKRLDKVTHRMMDHRSGCNDLESALLSVREYTYPHPERRFNMGDVLRAVSAKK